MRISTQSSPQPSRRKLAVGVGLATLLVIPSASAFAAPKTTAQPSPKAWPSSSRAPGAESPKTAAKTAARSAAKAQNLTDPPLRKLSAKVGVKFGAAVNDDLLGSDSTYTALLNREFSTVTPENVMKWGPIEPTQGKYDWAGGDRLVANAKKNNQLVRGHNLVWHSQLPAWLSSDGAGMTSSFSAAELRAILKKHVQDVAGHYKGQIWQWDVVNEAFNDDGTPRKDIWYQAFGNSTDYIPLAFQWAHEADPKAKLFYNDYNIEGSGVKSDAVYQLVRQMKARRIPIDGVGFQTHLSTAYGFPDMQANMTRFAKLGLDVAETEVDVRTPVTAGDTAGTFTDTPATPPAKYAQQAYWSQALQACLLIKRCISFTAWGVSDANSWIPGVFAGEGSALLFDDYYQPKAEYYVVQNDLKLAAGAPRNRG